MNRHAPPSPPVGLQLPYLPHFIPWLAWETDSNQVRRWLYPLKGHLAAWSTQCTDETPEWLQQLSRQMATEHDSPANQLAYVSTTGELFSCTNGWEGTPLFSPRVTPETPQIGRA